MSDRPAIAPPRWARWIILACAPRRDRAAIAGDLAERFERQVRELGSRRARRWYASQTVRSLLPLSLASFGDASLRRWIAGALAGVFVSSFAPAIIDRLVRPEVLTGLPLTAWYVVLGVASALAGGFAAVRVARTYTAAPMLALVWLLYAPAGIHLVRDPGRLVGEAPWLLLAVSAAIAGGGLAARRPLSHD